METLGSSIAKYLLFLFNLLFSVMGLVVVVVGGVWAAALGTSASGLYPQALTAPIFLIVVGVVVFVIAFLGCCGAIKENTSMLLAFAACLGLLLVLGLALAGLAGAALSSRGAASLEATARTSLNATIERNSSSESWDNIQRAFNCCGVEGPEDWGRHLPPSCCSPATTTNPARTCTQTMVVGKEGCLKTLGSQLHSAAAATLGLALSLAFLQVMGIVMACCLASAVRREREET